MANAEDGCLLSDSVDAGMTDWRKLAEASRLLHVFRALRGDESDDWLDAAVLRLPETLRLNPCRDDLEWTGEKLVDFGGETSG